LASRDFSVVIHWKIFASSADSTIKAVVRFFGVWNGLKSRWTAKRRNSTRRTAVPKASLALKVVEVGLLQLRPHS